MYEEQPDEQLEEIEVEAIGIEIASQPIELFKIFKIANLVGSGGEAKHIISEGYVAVNGEIETRKRCKVYDGDLIEFNQEYYLVICDEAVEGREPINDYFGDNPLPEVEPEEILPPESVKEECQPDEKPTNGRKSIKFF